MNPIVGVMVWFRGAPFFNENSLIIDKFSRVILEEKFYSTNKVLFPLPSNPRIIILLSLCFMYVSIGVVVAVVFFLRKELPIFSFFKKVLELDMMSSPRQKVIFVMIDGVGDINQPSLSPWETPLQKAKIPNMDLLSEFGANGLMDPVETGLACGSDTAHMSIFGYDPRKHYKGRGSFESMGAGLEMIKGDIAFKSNFATWNSETEIVEKRRADREFEHLGPTLCDYLNHVALPNFPEYRVEVKYATEHRCGVRVRGKNLSGDITGTDPLRDNLKLKICKPKKGHESDESAVFTSKVLSLSFDTTC